MKGEVDGDRFDGMADIAWVPAEFKSKLGDITNYASVPYATGDVFPTDTPAEGLGDPCHFAKKDGVADGYRMPTGNPYEQFTREYWYESGGTFGQPGGASDEGQFYPAAGYRGNSDGMVYDQGVIGYYWSSSPYNGSQGYILAFYVGGVYQFSRAHYAYGFAVRCVRIVN